MLSGLSGSVMQLPLQQSEPLLHEKPEDEQHLLFCDESLEHAPALPFMKHLSASPDVGHL
jgi:hypothetical protein